jgi:hypothetical protein
MLYSTVFAWAVTELISYYCCCVCACTRCTQLAQRLAHLACLVCVSTATFLKRLAMLNG